MATAELVPSGVSNGRDVPGLALVGARERLSAVRMPALDGIRGIAVSLVLVGHADAYLMPLPRIVHKLLSPSWLGVNIFFVLSGFLITGILLDTKESPRYFQSFYMRRILRIFPLYFVTLALVFGVFPLVRLAPRFSASDQWWFWSYLYNWRAASGFGVWGISHFWSLAVEEQFYFVWPLAVFVIPRRYLPWFCGTAMAASFLFRVCVFAFGLPAGYAYFATPARVEDLSVGALAAWTARDRIGLSRARGAFRKAVPVCIAAFLAAFLLGRGFEHLKPPALIFGASAVSVMVALTILHTLELEGEGRQDGRALRHVLSARSLGWLGTYSYGIYVFHLPLMSWAVQYLIPVVRRLAAPHWQAAAQFLAALMVMGLSCGFAYLSYHAFEKHFLALKRRFRS